MPRPPAPRRPAAPLLGARFAAGLGAFLLFALGLLNWLVRADHAHARASRPLDTFEKSTAPLPTPPPVKEDEDEWDPDKD